MLRRHFVVLAALVPLFLSGCGDDSPIRPGTPSPKTGPTLYNHFKTFTIWHDHLTSQEAVFVAEHCDLFVGDGDRIAEMRAINPAILVLAYMSAMINGAESFGAGCTINEFCAETFAAEHGYDVEDFFLHYKQDICYEANFPVGGPMTVSIHGWNPGRDAGDPPATAAIRSEARVWGSWDYRQRWGNVGNPGWQHWKSAGAVNLCDCAGGELDGVLLDGVARSLPEMEWMQFDKICEYAGETVTSNFSLIDDNYAFVIYLRDYLAQAFGSPKIIAGNATHPWYVVNEAANAHRLQEKFDWFLLENGIQADYLGNQSTCSYEITWTLLTQVRDLAKEGKKILFGAKDNTSSDIGRLFVLSVFYLINHPNMYYWEHGDFVWWDVMGYDIGDPAGEPYLWESGSDPSAPANTFHIMARDYENVLVLVKIRSKLSTNLYNMASNTTHALGGNYRALDINGTPGPVITEITLRNNQAAILVPD